MNTELDKIHELIDQYDAALLIADEGDDDVPVYWAVKTLIEEHEMLTKLGDEATLAIEVKRLGDAVDTFACAMKAKLTQKAVEGRRGWDNPDFGPDIARALLSHVKRGSGQEVDIANLAMMLWWQDQHKLGK